MIVTHTCNLLNGPGSTGSIGTQTLDIVEEKPHLFEVTALAAGGNVDLLAEQIVKFKPKVRKQAWSAGCTASCGKNRCSNV